MTRLRVALLGHSVDDRGMKGSGMELACAELARNACDDVDFVVLSSDLPKDLLGKVDWRRVPLPRRPSLLRLLVFWAIAGWKLRSVEATIVHTTGAIVPNRISLATVHYCHAGFRGKTGQRAPADASGWRRLAASFYRAAAELAERRVYRPGHVDCLVAVSDGVAEEVRAHFAGVNVTVIPNGVDTRRFRPDPVARTVLRDELNVPDDDVVALFVGGDWRRKGLDLVIRALGGSQAESRLRLWVVGLGDEARYAALARAEGVEEVRFFGRRRDAERFYAAGDLLLLPSLYETFSLAAYEAAASGIPVVATPVSGIRELVQQGGGGVLVERDASSIAEALGLLTRDAHLRRAIGERGRAWAERFSWQASAAATVDLYRRLAEGVAP